MDAGPQIHALHRHLLHTLRTRRLLTIKFPWIVVPIHHGRNGEQPPDRRWGRSGVIHCELGLGCLGRRRNWKTRELASSVGANFPRSP